jgi:hypothetical protein
MGDWLLAKMPSISVGVNILASYPPCRRCIISAVAIAIVAISVETKISIVFFIFIIINPFYQKSAQRYKKKCTYASNLNNYFQKR